MIKIRLYISVLIASCTLATYGQEMENPRSVQDDGKNEIIYYPEEKTAIIEESVVDVQTAIENELDSLRILQNKVMEDLDSIMQIPSLVMSETTDSLTRLAAELETKLATNIDSLKSKVIRLQEKGGEHLNRVSEKAHKINTRIDSMQGALNDKINPEQLSSYSKQIPDLGDRLKLQEGTSIPELQKLSIPELPGLKDKLPGKDNTLVSGNGVGSTDAIKRLTSAVDDRLGKIPDVSTANLLDVAIPDGQLSDVVGEQLPEMKQYQELVKDPVAIDQATDAEAAQLAEFQNLNSETKELATIKELPESMLADLKRYQDAEAMKAEAKNVAVEKATDYFAGHQEELAEAQNMMAKLKKKYSYMPDSRDLSSAVKVNSLKNEPVKKRFALGLGFQLQRTNPISMDLAPHVMYKFNKLFAAGVSGTYRVSLGIENNNSAAINTSSDVYGLSGMIQHKVWKGFFGHGEFQYMSTPMKDPATGTDLETRRWNEGLLLGIGKQIGLSKALRGQIIFTYDFLHDEYSPNPKAWNIRFGFQLGSFKLKELNL